MKLYCSLSELFLSYFVFFVFSFNESFNAVNICIYRVFGKSLCTLTFVIMQYILHLFQ